MTTNWIVKLVGWRSKVKRGDWGVDSTQRPDETALLMGKRRSRSSETMTLANVATSFLTSGMWEVEYGLSVLFGPQRRSLMHTDPIQGSMIWHEMVFVSWNTAQVFVESILCTLAPKPQVQDTHKPPDGGWHAEQLEVCGEIALPWRRQDSVDEVHDLQVVICKWCSFWERLLNYRRASFFIIGEYIFLQWRGIEFTPRTIPKNRNLLYITNKTHYL